MLHVLGTSSFWYQNVNSATEQSVSVKVTIFCFVVDSFIDGRLLEVLLLETVGGMRIVY